MTEEDAKTKWCPFARVSLGGGDSGNRGGFGAWGADVVERKSLCIGSACMAWRFDGAAEWHGYCGLAGAPQ